MKNDLKRALPGMPRRFAPDRRLLTGVDRSIPPLEKTKKPFQQDRILPVEQIGQRCKSVTKGNPSGILALLPAAAGKFSRTEGGSHGLEHSWGLRTKSWTPEGGN